MSQTFGTIFPNNGGVKMSIPQALSAALLRLLRPLVKVLLRNGIPYAAFAETARRAYVEVAEKEFGLPGRKQTASRISTLTGLTRKEVARIQSLEAAAPPEPVERFHRPARVIGG